MIIDCHAHVFAFPVLKNVNYDLPWVSAQQQIKIMDSKGIDKAVILPLNNAECSADQQHSKQSDGRAWIGWLAKYGRQTLPNLLDRNAAAIVDCPCIAGHSPNLISG